MCEMKSTRPEGAVVLEGASGIAGGLAGGGASAGAADGSGAAGTVEGVAAAASAGALLPRPETHRARIADAMRSVANIGKTLLSSALASLTVG